MINLAFLISITCKEENILNNYIWYFFVLPSIYSMKRWYISCPQNVDSVLEIEWEHEGNRRDFNLKAEDWQGVNAAKAL